LFRFRFLLLLLPLLSFLSLSVSPHISTAACRRLIIIGSRNPRTRRAARFHRCPPVAGLAWQQIHPPMRRS